MQGSFGFDIVSDSFECNDEDFAKARASLNNSISQIEKALRKRPNVENVTISKVLPACALQDFELTVLHGGGCKVMWNYESKKGKDSGRAPQEYTIYSSTNKILFEKPVFPQVSHRKNAISEVRTLATAVVSVTPAQTGPTPDKPPRRVKAIVTSPVSPALTVDPDHASLDGETVTKSVVVNKYEPAVVSDEKQLATEKTHHAEKLDSHTKRLTSTVSSPTPPESISVRFDLF